MRYALSSLLLVTALLMGSGCRRAAEGDGSPASAPPSAQTVADTTNGGASAAEPIKPMPGIAEEYPAPANLPSLDIAETARAAKPDGAKENLTLAYCYYQAKAFAQAAPAFERAIQLSPNDPQPYLYLGYTQMAAGALDSAIKTFDSVLALPDISRDVKSVAYLNKGYALGALGKKQAAREAFVQSLGNNTKQGLASLALGGFAAEQKQTEQARDFFTDAARDLGPGRHQARAFSGLGLLSEQAGDIKAARTYYKQALDANKDDEDTWARDGLKRLAGKPDTTATGTAKATKS